MNERTFVLKGTICYSNSLTELSITENGYLVCEDGHPIDRDPVCGFNGIINDECPCCGRTEDEIPFERIRRITGYLVGTLDRFNDAKRAEVRDRVKHG